MTLIGVVVVAMAIGAVARFVVRRVVSRIVKRTPYRWDTLLYGRGIFSSAARFLPPLLIYLSLPVIFTEPNGVQLVAERVSVGWMIAVAIRMLSSFGSFVDDMYRAESEEMARQRPITGYVQLAKIFIYVVGVVLIFTTLMGVSPVGILGGVGALSAVLLLVFRDAILGFVSAVQLSANNMVSIGDWIEVPKYGADGPVMDITLQTVKVRNWDQTITSLPSYALISDSFKNWRGIDEADGRRIKRSIYIDIRSISFCSQELIDRFRRMPLIADYMEQKLAKIASTSSSEGLTPSAQGRIAEKTAGGQMLDETDMTVGRHLTNLGTFRAYALAYMEANPGVQQSLIQMVRQLQPAPMVCRSRFTALRKRRNGSAMRRFNRTCSITSLRSFRSSICARISSRAVGI